MSKPVWMNRIQANPAPHFEKFQTSILEDAEFANEELQATHAHIETLLAAGFLTTDDAVALKSGIKGIQSDISSGKFELDPELEDIHMNVESMLAKVAPIPARKLHAGRSRNDQVATILTLKGRGFLQQLLGELLQIDELLVTAQCKSANVAYFVKTHGVAAQPATVNYVLAGYRYRFSELHILINATLKLLRTSPLGSGAVAGSTLKLDSAVGAAVLGLTPPVHALVHTGTRDTVLDVLHVTTKLGDIFAGFAQDLLDAFHAGALKLDGSLTTGSSLMPHKRNPDSLELVRGGAKQLCALELQCRNITLGMPLGYHRDFQQIKPILLDAIHLTKELTSVLGEIISGMNWTATTATHPGVYATDALDALVESGMIFRDAYDALGRVFNKLETGTPLTKALGEELPNHAQHVAPAFEGKRTRKTPGSPGNTVFEAQA